MAKKSDPVKERQKRVIKTLGKKKLLDALDSMLLIRNFEVRAEAAYQMGKIGGFFHSYIGQEAIASSIQQAIGKSSWYTTTYRCHALALILGVTPNEIMSELYGRANGNAKGRGGSMHLFTDNMLGGGGIVGGHVPIATGAAFASKYLKDKTKSMSTCFLGDGAVAQGAFHESLNLASLWDLPCLYIIENNQWGMGTAVERAICVDKLAEDKAPGYNMEGYTVDGMDFFACYELFSTLTKKMKKDSRPVLVEAVTERFRGHSVSDPAHYRCKDSLAKAMEAGPIKIFKETLIKEKLLTEKQFKDMDKKNRDLAVSSMQHADESPWPELDELEEGVFSP
ncbi:Pyruvate dehydrogenase E1 component subunit alpha [Chlamydiales bacterium SCGC AB-751-O23]|nr:Pyruvate dehydrogenase E1 component subunit alpha [Chlamydiales bacterium SCGC AB-751-O23]